MQAASNFALFTLVTKQNFRDICRSCLINSGSIDLYQTKFQEFILSDLIHFHFNEEICPLDEYPTKICCSCLKHILRSFQFIKRLRDNQKYLQQLYDIFKDIPENIEKVNVINKEILTHASLSDEILKDEDLMKCPDEEKNSLEIFEKLSDTGCCKDENPLMPISKAEDTDEIDIVEHGIKFERESDVESHTSDNCNPEHGSNSTPEESQNTFEIITILGEDSNTKLDEQSKTGNKKKFMSITSKLRNKHDWRCFDCLKVFETLKSLIGHSKETGHPIPPRFRCEICIKPFKTAKDLKSHEILHNKGRVRSICDICGASVLYRNLKRHLLSHREKANICQYCAKAFVQAGSLALHVRNEHEGKRRMSLCSICGKVFPNTPLLTTHLNTHSEEELKDVAHGCQECKKYFISEDSLKIHILKTHVDPVRNKKLQCLKKTIKKKRKDYVYGPRICTICSKSISYIGYTAHMRVHAGIKPFHCKICSQSFKQQAHLQAHMNIHLGIKPYACRFCDKTFRHLTSRRTHERAHKGEKPFKCPVCDKGFYESSPMKKHLKIHSKLVKNKGTDNVH